MLLPLGNTLNFAPLQIENGLFGTTLTFAPLQIENAPWVTCSAQCFPLTPAKVCPLEDSKFHLSVPHSINLVADWKYFFIVLLNSVVLHIAPVWFCHLAHWKYPLLPLSMPSSIYRQNSSWKLLILYRTFLSFVTRPGYLQFVWSQKCKKINWKDIMYKSLIRDWWLSQSYI